MKQHQETFAVTLHWLRDGAEQSATILCEDGPPAQLLPLLLRGCGLPLADAAGTAQIYSLRLGAAAGRRLLPDEPVSRQGVRSGSHLWLAERGAASLQRCLLGLPDGSELLVPRSGVALQRAWLLQALALLNPAAHSQELARIERRASPYRCVSSRTHCTLAPTAGGVVARTDRSDVVTLLNGVPLRPGDAAELRTDDLLVLGEGGLPLTITLLGG